MNDEEITDTERLDWLQSKFADESGGWHDVDHYWMRSAEHDGLNLRQAIDREIIQGARGVQRKDLTLDSHPLSR